MPGDAGDKADTRADDPRGQEFFNREAYYLKSQQGPKSARSLLGIARSAVRLAHEASPRLFYISAAAQLSIAALLGAQVLLGKLALEAILRATESGGSIVGPLPPLIGLVAAGALGSFASVLQTQVQRLLGERVQEKTLDSMLGVTTTVDLETFESPDFFDDLQRVQTNALIQPLTLTQGLISTLGGLLGAAGLTVALLFIEPLVVPILLVSALPLWLLSRATGRMEFGFNVAQTAQARLRLYIVQTLTGRDEAKEMRAFGVGRVLRDRWATSYREYLGDLRAHVRRRLMLALAGAVATVVVTTAAFAVLISFVLSGRIGLADAGAAVLAIRLLGTRIEAVFKGVGGLFESSLFLIDLHRFLARAPVRAASSTVAPAESFEELRVDDVHFAYPNAAEPALRGVSMQIGSEEVVALVGENGSGKTTLAKLIGALFVPSQGRILWDDTDLRVLGLDRVRGNIGVIFQDFVRYQLTARENIGFGRPEAVTDRRAVTEAARLAGASDYLERLPQGYETSLGKEFRGGYDLSLGQWQRIAIARAFFREAQLLILDEPTAALDARSENEIFDHVRKLASGRAVLLISHRFSTVRSADRIYVLHEGQIVEQGSHEELIELGGRYAELFNLQADAYR